LGADRNTDTYRKGRLVPMVERVPFLKVLKSLKFLHIDPAKGLNNYGRPDSLKLLYTQGGIPTNVLICYESAFGDHTRQKTLMGGQWIAMVTNDGWWFQSSGYVQHAGLSVIRAIENRRAIARCANNGRSMVVDAFGHASKATNWWEATVFDATLPLYKTYYVRHGDFIGRFAVWLTLILVLLGFYFDFRQKKKLHEPSVSP
jgi:apolipoprotein N-acyltransferase